MTAYLVVSYGDAELEWLFADEAEAFELLVEQMADVSMERIAYGNRLDFRAAQDEINLQRERYITEMAGERSS